MEHVYELNREEIQEYFNIDFNITPSMDFIRILRDIDPRKNDGGSFHYSLEREFYSCSEEKKEILREMLSNMKYLDYKIHLIYKLE